MIKKEQDKVWDSYDLIDEGLIACCVLCFLVFFVVGLLHSFPQDVITNIFVDGKTASCTFQH